MSRGNSWDRRGRCFRRRQADTMGVGLRTGSYGFRGALPDDPCLPTIIILASGVVEIIGDLRLQYYGDPSLGSPVGTFIEGGPLLLGHFSATIKKAAWRPVDQPSAIGSACRRCGTTVSYCMGRIFSPVGTETWFVPNERLRYLIPPRTRRGGQAGSMTGAKMRIRSMRRRGY